MTDVLVLNRTGLKVGDVVWRVLRVRLDGTAELTPLGIVTRLVDGDEPLAAVRVSGPCQLEVADHGS